MKHIAARPWLATGLLWCIAAAIAAFNLGPLIGGAGVRAVFSLPSAGDSQAVLLHYSVLPRLAMSCVGGFALGLSGMLFQHVLRNPLASPSTLGVEAGAQLALGIAMLWFPALLGWSRDTATAFGGFAAMAVVFAVAWRFKFQPIAVILTGLVMGLYCTAIVTLLTLMNDHYLSGLFVWGGGSLNQNDWRSVAGLLPKVVGFTVLALLLVRQLSVLTLGEAAKGLGIKLQFVRAAALFVAVALTTFTVSAVGVIGFLGLAAPAIARAIGARRINTRLIVAPLIGAALLIIVDQIMQIYTAKTGSYVPTGAATALIGVPVLLFVMLKRGGSLQTAIHSGSSPAASSRPLILIATLAGLVLAVAMVAIFVGRGVDGSWISSTGATLKSLLPWRLPRLVAATSAGIMLALAGSLLQRLTGNAMASPEVLGVSAGTAFGLLCILFVVSEPTITHRLIGGFLGAGTVLAILFAMSRAAHSGNQFLMFGVSLGAFLTALISVVLASGDPRALSLISWMAGSTYGVSSAMSLIISALAIVGIITVMLLVRPLQQFALGDLSAHSHGVDVKKLQILILAVAALLTAMATLIVGPLSFVGLMAPHLAQRLGLTRGLPHLMGSALCGALLMATADFIGRTAYFPWQLPTGLVATLLGGPVFALLLIRGRRLSKLH
ncbi:Fe(3+)-hydroxamate ABC transporter permease FhuB [Phyllobacterium zundukense]|jgi:iron complex transport system permease protein|uniref:Fe(3+)-hydroxamate ABC transporter permease FhuB n=1 Tax=Phyllobacterium zundukense TaxID=1867719 RepID=A0ACD4CU82_9HYPH|nr:Fe(3+)-hydroxamate ABC transporter permease FhuB [Phyllobacterium zundukense]UXN57140.1 Fe(3+)-hydroxamate ABC transporter permease FhuB [Phyllobacterium zundukense]